MVRHGLTRSELGKQSQQRRRQNYWRRRLWWLGLSLFILAGLISLTHLDRLLINQVVVEGAKATPSVELEQEIRAGLAGNYFYLFPRRNIFFWPKDLITANLAAKYKSLQSFTLDREGQTIQLLVQERQGAYIWCQAVGGDSCYLLDASGFAFAPAPTFSGQPFFELVSQSATLNDRPLVASDFARVLELRTRLDRILAQSVVEAEVRGVDLDELGAYRFRLGEELVLALPPDITNERLERDLLTALMAETFVDEYQREWEHGRHLLYLDLQVPGRIFYKFSS